MVKVDLKEADLHSAKLGNADLSEADLIGAKVTDEQLKTVKSLNGTVMPNGLNHP